MPHCRSYEKRKQAALEIEQVVKEVNAGASWRCMTALSLFPCTGRRREEQGGCERHHRGARQRLCVLDTSQSSERRPYRPGGHGHRFDGCQLHCRGCLPIAEVCRVAGDAELSRASVACGAEMLQRPGRTEACAFKLLTISLVCLHRKHEFGITRARPSIISPRYRVTTHVRSKARLCRWLEAMCWCSSTRSLTASAR